MPRAEREMERMTLDVTNAKGKRTARNVEVLVTVTRGQNLHPLLRDGSLAWDAVGEPTRIDIPSGTTRRVILLWMGHGSAVLDHATRSALWDTLDEITQEDTEGCLGIFGILGARTDKEAEWVTAEMRHRVRLTVTADNADAVEYELEFDGTAGWAESDPAGGWKAGIEWSIPPHRVT